jgi:hypothetical protein
MEQEAVTRSEEELRVGKREEPGRLGNGLLLDGGLLLAQGDLE